MSTLKSIFKKISGLEKQLNKINLEILEQKMVEEKFDENLKQELLLLFRKRIEERGEKEFQTYLYNLHFRVPEEIRNERESTLLYEKSSLWIEEEVKKLEKEIGLSFEEQTKDIENLNIKARKTQLVIRHRLYEIVLDMLDS